MLLKTVILKKISYNTLCIPNMEFLDTIIIIEKYIMKCYHMLFLYLSLREREEIFKKYENL